MTALPLLKGSITYADAVDEDDNIIQQLRYPLATEQLYERLWDRRETICALTKHHVGLGQRDSCVVSPCSEWLRGSFNVCIPVQVKTGDSSKRLLLRCALPHKLAESQYSGTIDEKVGCEIGAYAWMQEYCPDIRIAFLYGFGFTDNLHFTHEKQRPFYIRLLRVVQRCVRRLFRYPDLLSRYTSNPTTYNLPTAYMLLEYISPEIGQTLYGTLEETLKEGRDDPIKRQRLFQGITRIMLSLARIPQPRIGSFQFNGDCTVSLTNRPLNCTMMIMENEGMLRTMHKDDTYTSTDSYVSDMITVHDTYFLSKPNVAYDDKDCRGQLAVKMLLRGLSHRFISRERRQGPFILQLTDLHASNILVDEQWNVTCLIDLEWLCALPAEMLSVPYWLTGCAIDHLKDDNLGEFEKVHEEFMLQFEEQEHSIRAGHGLTLSAIMRETWESRGTFFWYCITSINAMDFVLDFHICSRFSSRLTQSIEKTLSRFWCEDVDRVVERKLADHKMYDTELRRLFDEQERESVVEVPDH